MSIRISNPFRWDRQRRRLSRSPQTEGVKGSGDLCGVQSLQDFGLSRTSGALSVLWSDDNCTRRSAVTDGYVLSTARFAV
jgi:hypothetical protein